MLQNEYFIAKIGVDTAENEPSEVWPACLPAPEPPPWVDWTAMDAVEKVLRCFADEEAEGHDLPVDPVQNRLQVVSLARILARMRALCQN